MSACPRKRQPRRRPQEDSQRRGRCACGLGGGLMVHIAVLLSAPLLRAAVPAFTLLVALLARMPVEHQPDGSAANAEMLPDALP